MIHRLNVAFSIPSELVGSDTAKLSAIDAFEALFKQPAATYYDTAIRNTDSEQLKGFLAYKKSILDNTHIVGMRFFPDESLDRQVTVQFHVPDDVPDLCWRGEDAGDQVFDDVVTKAALNSYLGQIGKTKEYEEQQGILLLTEIVAGSEVVGKQWYADPVEEQADTLGDELPDNTFDELLSENPMDENAERKPPKP